MIQQAASLEDADRVLRENGKTFAWARRFLGRRHAERSTRLYAFCRYLDDVADELRASIQNLHVDVLRQFQIQKSEVAALLTTPGDAKFNDELHRRGLLSGDDKFVCPSAAGGEAEAGLAGHTEMIIEELIGGRLYTGPARALRGLLARRRARRRGPLVQAGAQ